MRARIYQPSKAATQSGWARTKNWVLEFEPEVRRGKEPIMGWTSSADTKTQVRLRFDTQAEAIAYAKQHGITYSLYTPCQRLVRPKSYAENFRADRKIRWTQ